MEKMAKQAADKTTQELPSMWVWEKLEDVQISLDLIKKRLDIEYGSWVKVKKEMRDLEQAGLNYAGTTWKDGKYLYLVYPVDESGHRRRDYVGANSKRIKEEIAKLERGKAYDELKARLQSLESKMSSAKYYADQVIRCL